LRQEEIKELIRKIALQNAYKYEGKAQKKPVIGRLLAEKPELKAVMREVLPLVEEVVEEVNRLTLEEQRKALEELELITEAPEREIEEEPALPPLPNADKYAEVRTRFSPNPDCVLHLGSARAIILSHEYARMYKGKFILRFEDTDPRLKKSALQFYDYIRRDLEWLGCKPDAEYIQSDRIELYYKYAEKLLEEENAYICTCKREVFQKKVRAGLPCPCRDLDADENLRRWRWMLDGSYGEGEAVVRVKTDMEHPNPAVRDWPALRIIDTKKHPHPRVGDKYRVWPLYNFACGIDDHLLKITHIIRGKEHLTNQIRQTYLYRHLGWQYPEAIHYGRLKITGASLSKSLIVKGVKEGLYKGWDDPRLATFMALRRRGIRPEAIRELILTVGPKPVDVTLSWKNLYAINRKLIDPIANRYFFIPEPIELIVRDVEEAYTPELPLHPDFRERGFRKFQVKLEDGKVYLLVSKGDLKILKEEADVRLIGLFNIKVESVGETIIEASFRSEGYEEAKKGRMPLIHWLPKGTGIPCNSVMTDGSVLKGVAEDSCRELRVDDIVQFERFGFVRVDKIGEDLTVYYTHR